MLNRIYFQTTRQEFARQYSTQGRQFDTARVLISVRRLPLRYRSEDLSSPVPRHPALDVQKMSEINKHEHYHMISSSMEGKQITLWKNIFAEMFARVGVSDHSLMSGYLYCKLPIQEILFNGYSCQNVPLICQCQYCVNSRRAWKFPKRFFCSTFEIVSRNRILYRTLFQYLPKINNHIFRYLSFQHICLSQQNSGLR